MRIQARFPEEWWPVILEAAVYLYNRTPREQNTWQTPLGTLNSWLKSKDKLFIRLQIPSFAHTFAYGCRAYPLLDQVRAGKWRLDFKLNPRTHIGYLMGYMSSNSWWIWVPVMNKCILTHDIHFYKSLFYDLQSEPMTRGLQRELALIAEILETTENSQTEQFHSAQRDVFSEDTIADLGTSFTLSRDQQQSVSQKILQPEDTNRNVPAQLPTPGLTPPPPLQCPPQSQRSILQKQAQMELLLRRCTMIAKKVIAKKSIGTAPSQRDYLVLLEKLS
jgi:hypothetical protein